MPVETAADRAAFVDPDEFGRPAVYTRSGEAEGRTLNVLFDRPVRTAGLEGSSVDATEAYPSAVCTEEALPPNAAQGDTLGLLADDGVTVAETYAVRALRPDGLGMVRLDLEGIAP